MHLENNKVRVEMVQLLSTYLGVTCILIKHYNDLKPIYYSRAKSEKIYIYIKEHMAQRYIPPM